MFAALLRTPSSRPSSQQQLHLTAALCTARSFVVVYLSKAIWLLLERHNNSNNNNKCSCSPKIHAQSISILLYLLDTYVSTVVSLSLSAEQQSLIPPSLVKNHLKFHHHKFVKIFSVFVCRFGSVWFVLLCFNVFKPRHAHTPSGFVSGLVIIWHVVIFVLWSR